MATIGVIGADAEKFRWPGPTTLMLTLATVCLVTSVQHGFNARRYFYSPADVESWQLSQDAVDGGLDEDTAIELVRQRQRRDMDEWLRLSQHGVLAYNLGILLLACGMALVLAAPEGASLGHAACRWTASATAAAGAVAELESMLRHQRVSRMLSRAARNRAPSVEPP
ncbi:hypothetical protein, partial [Streptomyces tubercidicus]|uniref:hypothetical protein n=1 Tax=Streptomyces tubercidicus TaxID=47759 RepID=UPI0036BED715